MEGVREDPGFGADSAPQPRPHLVSLSPFTPIMAQQSRRLSSHFSKPSRPVQSERKLAWLSLQGRLIGAEEASSARTIGGGLSGDEAMAWELFSPIHRILIVAVAAAAAAKSEKNRQIGQLKKSVQLRDQILLSMQEKLDSFCEQMNNIKEQPADMADSLNPKKVALSSEDASACWLCDQHRAQSNDLLLIDQGMSSLKAANGDEMFKRKSLSNEVEQEERRMSDLSDWASSVTSAAETNLNNLAMELDVYNLKRESEEKDAAIKDLSAFIHSKDLANSKRIQELEDIIRRKNMIITKLKKDMVVMEQKVVQLTRLRRRSFAGPSSETRQLPLLTDNLLYDMDSPTSSSSSDSDSSEKHDKMSVLTNDKSPAAQTELTCERASKTEQKSAPAKIATSIAKLKDREPKSRPVSPLKEKSLNQRPEMGSTLRPKQLSLNVDMKNSKRRAQTGFKDTAPQRRWF